jgi:3',5'-cyclic-AMP phosphodiesterase
MAEIGMKIAHISDIHLGSGTFVPQWGDNVVKIIEQESPDLLILTGDLTDNGYLKEFELAKQFLDRLEVPKRLIIPGNHDARNLGYTIFEDMFGDRFPTYEDKEVAIVGLDSTEPDLDDGHIGREHYGPIHEHLATDKVRMLFLHHHLIPIPGTGRERQIPSDAGDVLGLCDDIGVDVVLTGHKHLPWIWNLNGTYFITTGTATTTRLKGRSHPAMEVLEIVEHSITTRMIHTDDLTSRETLRTDLRRKR